MQNYPLMSSEPDFAGCAIVVPCPDGRGNPEDSLHFDGTFSKLDVSCGPTPVAFFPGPHSILLCTEAGTYGGNSWVPVANSGTGRDGRRGGVGDSSWPLTC